MVGCAATPFICFLAVRDALNHGLCVGYGLLATCRQAGEIVEDAETYYHAMQVLAGGCLLVGSGDEAQSALQEVFNKAMARKRGEAVRQV